MIAFSRVAKSFDGGRSYALREIGLQVERGETLVLLGSSGSGKSTLLKLTNRLLERTAGRIEVEGRDIDRLDPIDLRRRMGYVFQGIGLLPHLTIRENLALVLRLLGRPRQERRRRAEELLHLLGLTEPGLADRFPEELSGGQQQRVGVGRALAADPPFLLMDEPFGALDALTRDTLQQELLALRERLGKTILFVTHDIFEALTLADRIAVLHEGRLEQVGRGEEILRRPATEFVRRLFARPAEQLAAFREEG